MRYIAIKSCEIGECPKTEEITPKSRLSSILNEFVQCGLPKEDTERQLKSIVNEFPYLAREVPPLIEDHASELKFKITSLTAKLEELYSLRIY